MFQTKGNSDLALLPVTSNVKDNLELHIFGINYLANMYVNTLRLHMCLDDPTYHKLK